MSYCRWGEDGSDVYVYGTNDGDTDFIVCCGCTLIDADTDKVAATPAAMIDHLESHRAAGDHVPEFAFERLRKEAAGEPES